jgi:hypothetical protein
MTDNPDNDGRQPVAAPPGVTRLMVIILAALVVVALLAWFLLGTHRAPGPAATDNVQTQTEQAFEDTVIVNPDGSARQQITQDQTLNPADDVINAPTVTNDPATGEAAR